MSSESDEEPPGYEQRDWRSPYAKWVDENYDALQGMFQSFKELGQRVFGFCFHQAGNFSDFTYYVYTKTVIM